MNGAKTNGAEQRRPLDTLLAALPQRPGIKTSAKLAPAEDGRLAQKTRTRALHGQITAAKHLKTSPVTRSFGH